ncbi:MAG: hypothetical protein ACRELB_01215, partial [Polyangiaceae bacterium]
LLEHASHPLPAGCAAASGAPSSSPRGPVGPEGAREQLPRGRAVAPEHLATDELRGGFELPGDADLEDVLRVGHQRGAEPSGPRVRCMLTAASSPVFMSAFREPEPPPDVAVLLEERERLTTRAVEVQALLRRARKIRRWKRIAVVLAATALVEGLAVMAAKLLP